MGFQMTSAAAREILAAAGRSGAEGMALRIAAKSIGDGIAFGMGFDDPAPDDQVVEFEGLTVLIGAPSAPWLEGTLLDYAEVGEGRRDFVFMGIEEPQAGGCATPARGCGGGSCSRCG